MKKIKADTKAESNIDKDNQHWNLDNIRNVKNCSE
jgi:hypothetical protein